MHLHMEMDIPIGGRVLDIGPGGFPDPAASIIVDRFIGDEGTGQRGGAPQVRNGLDLIQADASALPFRDSEFDYVMFSHVIEHIPEDTIAGVVKELQRVGRSGYIEAPSVAYESVRQIKEHLWYAVCMDNTVYLAPKANAGAQGATPMEALYFDPDFISVVEQHPSVFFTGIEWHDAFRFEVLHDLAALMDIVPIGSVNSEVEAVIAAKTAKVAIDAEARARGLRRRRFTRFLPPVIGETVRAVLHPGDTPNSPAEPLRLRWQDVVVCPVCHGELRIDTSARTIDCTACGASFSIRADGVPSFLTRDQG